MADIPNVPPLISGNLAFFFDPDDTLAELQPHPDRVYIPAIVCRLLQKISVMSGGTLALISGRSMAEPGKLATPFHFPMAGVHGAGRRDINDNTYVVTLAEPAMQALHVRLSEALARLPGIVEKKKNQ